MKKLLFLLLALFSYLMPTNAQEWVTCPKCNGAKSEYVRCSSCHNGAIMCTNCISGKKRTKCSSCSYGYISKTVNQTCSTCRGSKTITQNQPRNCTCRGGSRPIVGRNGTVTSTTCSRCNGRGMIDNYVRINCTSCGGSGSSGTRTVQERCTRCSNGYITETCGRCNGRGAYPCSRCQGYANIKKSCDRCNGYGKIAVGH